MRGIKIILNNWSFHTGDDLDLVQEEKKIGKPVTQTFTVQVPGRNGLLNLTKALTGRVNYYNRPLSFKYFGSGNRETLLSLDQTMSRLHGQTIQIIDDDYPGYYFEGEATVDSTIHGNYITISLSVDAQPFRKKLEPTVYSRSVSGFAVIDLNNEGVPVVPEIYVSSDMTIDFNEKSVNVKQGAHVIDDLYLETGVNRLLVTGTGVITFTYREGVI